MNCVMKPYLEFDLKIALKDLSRVRTRGGKKVLQLAHFPESIRPVVVLVEGNRYITNYPESGKVFNTRENEQDLVLLSNVVKIEWWLVWSVDLYRRIHHIECPSEGDAINAQRELIGSRGGHKFLRITHICEEFQLE